MFSNSVKLFSVAGFDIKIDPSWLIIASLIAWSLSQHYFPVEMPGHSGLVYGVTAIASTIVFFASLLLHELAHCFVARRFGVPIAGITLFLFGGVAEMENRPQSPKAEFLIALAGPVMSLALALGFVFLSGIAALFGRMTVLSTVFSYLAAINLILAVFNLLPAFPLDGGRIMRAFLWWRSGNLLRANEIASKSGIFFAFALMGLGILFLFQGALLPGLWQIMIGGFLLVAARSSHQGELMQAMFDKRTVGSLMQSNPVTVHPGVTLSTFVNQVVLKHGLSFIPVVEDGVLLGHIDHKMLLGIDRENWSNTQVGDVYAGLDPSSSVDPDVSIEELIQLISTSGRRKFLVVKDGNLVGVISLSDLARHMRLSDLMTAA